MIYENYSAIQKLLKVYSYKFLEKWEKEVLK